MRAVGRMGSSAVRGLSLATRDSMVKQRFPLEENIMSGTRSSCRRRSDVGVSSCGENKSSSSSKSCQRSFIFDLSPEETLLTSLPSVFLLLRTKPSQLHQAEASESWETKCTVVTTPRRFPSLLCGVREETDDAIGAEQLSIKSVTRRKQFKSNSAEERRFPRLFLTCRITFIFHLKN